MKTICRNIADFMEESAPGWLAESWDNVGLLAGSMEYEVGRILLALDVITEVVDEAIDMKADMIISHHPFIFKGLKSIVADEPKGNLACRIIKHGICVYCAHTNLDVAIDGVNDALAQKLGLTGTTNFKDHGSSDAGGFQHGLGKVGSISEKMVLFDFAEKVRTSLQAGSVKIVGNHASVIQKAAVFCGSFDDDLEAFKHSGADVLVTGDLKYHTAVDILQMGKCAVDAGHFNTERVILPVLAGKLKERFPEIEVFLSKKEKDPFSTY